MENTQKTLFISDLHLDKNNPAITELFLKFLGNINSSVDSLYILGDLFETWIGDDDDSTFHQQIINALHNITQRGIRLYFLAGNRDFLIGNQFSKDTGCTLLPDEKKIDLYNTPILLMHGDTLCTQDIAYQKWRKISHHPCTKKIFTWLPLYIRRKIAMRLRAKSAKYTRTMQLETLDVTQSDVVQVMKKHQTYTLIHGHTHRPAIHQFYIDGHPATRIVLDAWHEHGSVLIYDSNGHRQLMTLTNHNVSGL